MEQEHDAAVRPLARPVPFRSAHMEIEGRADAPDTSQTVTTFCPFAWLYVFYLIEYSGEWKKTSRLPDDAIVISIFGF